MSGCLATRRRQCYAYSEGGGAGAGLGSSERSCTASSVRDLEVKDDDLIAGTHGRGYLILDDVTPLRQISARLAEDKVHLYTPETAIHIRGDMNPPTPWPPDMATGTNPPDGAIFDYYLGPKISGVVTLEVLDSKGQLVARYNSNDAVTEVDPKHYPVPILWAKTPSVLSAEPGEHRFIWDLKYVQVSGMAMEPASDEAVPHNTPSTSTAPWILPGKYTVRLIAAGETQSQPFEVVMDPRVKTPMPELEAQFTLAKSIYDNLVRATTAIDEVTALRQQLKERSGQAQVAGAGPSIESKLDVIAGPEERGRTGGGGGARGGRAAGPANLSTVRAQLARLEHEIEAADTAPTTTQAETSHNAEQPLTGLLQQWQQLKQTDLNSLNDQLQRSHLAKLDLNTDRIEREEQEEIDMGDDE